MEGLINKFFITNYKNILDLSLTDLNVVNVIYGPANVGKSNLLEILWMATNPTNLGLFTSGIGRRIPDFNTEMLSYIFNNPKKPIKLSINDDLKAVVDFRILQDEVELVSKAEVADIQDEYKIRFKKGPVIKEFLPAIKNPAMKQEPAPINTPYRAYLLNAPLINPRGIATMVDQWLRKGKKDQLLVLLSGIYNEKVEDIFPSPTPGAVFVATKYSVLPISLLGRDNLWLFNMFLISHNTKGSIILLDDVDGNVGEPLYVKTWEIILAVSDSVQFFLSVSSETFIKSLIEVKNYKEYIQRINVYYLEKGEGGELKITPKKLESFIDQ